MTQHLKQQEFLRGKFKAGQLSHAYLLCGQAGIGKKNFAKEFVKAINCLYSNFSDRENLSIQKKYCGNCVTCKQIEKELFPDLQIIKSINSDSSVKNEKDMMEIDVAQIRQVNNFLGLKSYYGNYKAVIIDNADRMNVEAQNSFLKTLEEPKGNTIIFLISSSPATLLPTIFSRCQTITFFPFENYTASSIEEKTLRELLPIIHAELAVKFNWTKKVNLEGEHFGTILKVLQRYFRNILLAKLGVQPSAMQNNYSIGKLKNILRLIESLHRQVSTTNASPKLALEVLLLEF